MADKIKRFLGNPVNEGDKVLSEDYKKWLNSVNRLCDDMWSKYYTKLLDALHKVGKEYWYFHKRSTPRQDFLYFLIENEVQEAKDWLSKHPEPIKYIDASSIETEDNKVYYGLYNDGGNCYSSRDDGNWYWSSTKDECRTKEEFRRSCKRAAIRHAETNYREYVPQFIQVKIFESKNAFLKACKKVGLQPKIEE